MECRSPNIEEENDCVLDDTESRSTPSEELEEEEDGAVDDDDYVCDDRRDLIFNVASYIKKERSLWTALRGSLPEKVALMMNHPISRVVKVLNQGRADVDDFGQGLIRNNIYRMYQRGEQTSIMSVLTVVKSNKDIGFSGSDIYLRMILLSMGFKEKWNKELKCDVLKENMEITLQRSNFLCAFTSLKKQGSSFVYLGDTSFYSQGHAPNEYSEDSDEEIQENVVLHAGGEKGFIEGAECVLESSKASITAERFNKWIKEKLLPKLKEPSIIIMDNSSIHNFPMPKKPSNTWSKDALRDFLSAHNVSFHPESTYQVLLHLSLTIVVKERYEVDDIIQTAGHQVLRLPPFHCHYNPIGLVWRDCKRYYESVRETRCEDNSNMEKWKEALQQVTVEKWKNFVMYTEKIIEEDWHQELQFDAEQKIVKIEIPQPDDEICPDPSKPTSSSLNRR
ncbi:hypothetical protein R5R35_012588 [Gryllus longicercus]|uniref:Tc1-like transposase DDE domain-containing protein n=1 Tax=Gryllus longicercus TaxID=2509291 RepID=A0AAN9VHZ5_9ORTH